MRSQHRVPILKSSSKNQRGADGREAAQAVLNVIHTLPGAENSNLVDTRQAALHMGRSPATLKRWRYEGVGPEYIVYRGRVRYDVGVLARFNDENTRMPSVRAAMEADREDL